MLFATFPPLAGDDVDAQLEAYALALSSYDMCDVDAAIGNFIAGKAPGHNPAFAPSAPQIGAECRRLESIRLESEERTKRYTQPQLPPPDVQHTPESRARIKAMVDAVASRARVDKAVSEKESKAKGEADTRWLLNRGDLVEEPGNPYPVSRALLRQFEVGDPEGQADAA